MQVNTLPRDALPSYVFTLEGVFARHGRPLYLVGGSVRNALLGLPLSDIDICGPAQPEEVAVMFSDVPDMRALPRAPEFGTLELQVREDGAWRGAEYTTFRHDSYRSGGHRPDSVAFTDSLEVDALRRDFSINAIYCHLGTGALVDPGGGAGDLRRRILRAATPDPEDMLRDDGLRLMRMARFAAQLQLAPEAAMLAAAERNVNLIRGIARERIWSELKLILTSDMRYPELRGTPEQSVGVGLRILREIGLLDILLCGYGEGGIDAATRLPCDLPLRLAALIPEGLRGDDVAKLLRGLRAEGSVIREVCALLDVHSQWREAPYGDGGGVSLRRRIWGMGPGNARRHGQWLGALGEDEEAQMLLSATEAMLGEPVAWDASQLALDGRALSALLGGAGPRVGAMQRLLMQRVAEQPVLNTRAALTRLCEELSVGI